MHDTTCPSPPDPTRPWNVDCSNVTLNDRLSLFSKWRGDKGADGTGLWHLMSGCPTNTEVGVAWLGTLCQTSATGSTGNFVSSTAVTTASRSEWQVVAHETGHNFGAIVSVLLDFLDVPVNPLLFTLARCTVIRWSARSLELTPHQFTVYFWL